MFRKVSLASIAAAALMLSAIPLWAQAQAPETVDELGADNDLLAQLDTYGLAADQLTQLVPILKTLDAKRQDLEAYKRSDEALAPLRALRDARIKGKVTPDIEDAAEPVWQKLSDLESAFEEAVPEAVKQAVKVLTDEQLNRMAEGGDAIADEADMILGEVEAAGELKDAEFTQWRDEQAGDAAKRMAPDDGQKAAQLEKGLQAFFDKVHKLSPDAYEKQADALYEELHTLLANAHPTLTRQEAEDQAGQELEFIIRAPRTLPLIEAIIQARA
jgi:hypothetical protein